MTDAVVFIGLQEQFALAERSLMGRVILQGSEGLQALLSVKAGVFDRILTSDAVTFAEYFRALGKFNRIAAAGLRR